MREKVKPMTIRDSESDKVWTLEFSRDSVKFAEARGVSIDGVGDSPMTMLPELFYSAFRKNHRNISKAETDKILFDELGGLTDAQYHRLMQLFAEPMNTLIKDKDEDGGETQENPKMVVELD